MEQGKLTLAELAEKSVFEIGTLIEKGLAPATPAIKKFAEDASKHLQKVKQQAIAFNQLEKDFKIAPDRKAMLELLAKEEKLKQESLKTSKSIQTLELEKQKVITQGLRNQNAQITLQNKQNTQKTKAIKLTAEERYELSVLNKRAKEAAIISSKLSTEYEKQSVKLIQLRRRYKDVALTEGEASKKAKELRSQIQKLDATLKRVDANVGQYQRSVGNYSKALGFARGAVKNMMSAMGAVGGAVLFVRVMRDAGKTVLEFDRQLIAVKKTTNQNDAEIESFSKSVIQLGLDLKGISIKSLLKSSEIAGQLGVRGSENILKYASTLEKLKLTSDIIGEESARNFAKFIEISTDSVENADKLGSVITDLGNNFATTESQILGNTIEIQKGIAIYDANAQSVIALGAVTNSLGSEAEQARSAMQKTFKVLNDGAVTGKNLEKILKLTGQTQEEFIKGFKENSVDTFRLFVKGLSESDKAGVNLSKTLESLGLSEKRTEAVVGTLAKNYDKLEVGLKRANEEYINNIALNKEVDEATKSIQVKIEDLSDAWDGLVLNIDNGKGAFSNLFKSAIESATDFLTVLTDINTVTEIVGKGTKTFENDGLIGLYKDTVRLRDATKELQAIQKEFKTIDLSNINEVQSGIDIWSEMKKQVEGNIEVTKILDFFIGKLQNSERAYYEAGKDADDEKRKREKEILEAKEKLTEDEKKRLKKLSEDERKRQEKLNESLKKSAYELQKYRIEQEIEGLDEIATNEKNSYLDRIKALQEKENKQIELSDLTEVHLLSNQKLNADERILIEEKTSANLVDIYKKTNEEIDKLQEGLINDAPETVDEEFDYDAELVEKQKQRILEYADILNIDGTEALKRFEEIHGDSFENIESYYDKLNNVAKESSDLRKELEEDLARSSIEFVNTLFDAKISSIQDEIDASNEKYDTAIENAQNQYDEEGNLIESSDRRKEILENEKQAKEKELKKKELKEKRKQAIFNKVLAVAQIGFDLASTISKINLAAVAIDAISFGLGGIPYRAANIPLAIASSALQVGSILATPLPKYKQGRKGGKAEWAITGDGGVNEFVEKKDGSIYKTPNKDTLTYLEKDDIVHKDYNTLKMAKGLSEDTFNQLYRTVSGANLQSKYERANDIQQKITINNRINEQFIVNAIRESNKGLKKDFQQAMKGVTIKSQPTINIPTNYQKG